MAHVIHRQGAELGLESLSPVPPTPPSAATTRKLSSAQPSVTMDWAWSVLCSFVWVQNPVYLSPHEGSASSLAKTNSPGQRAFTSSRTLPTWIIPPLPSSLTQATPPPGSQHSSPSYPSLQQTLMFPQRVTVAHSSAYLQPPAQGLAQKSTQ